ncbi:hypothetical protein DFJ74DRAFT_647852 [Hyaloraphidium curvatum]|nr:hypothetical protein DFJ74DRAFT_647852 [Hyaloraphidium curvatum]
MPPRLLPGRLSSSLLAGGVPRPAAARLASPAFRRFASPAERGTSLAGLESWDCHKVAVWAFQVTDDPAILDFFAQRMRLNGLALSKLAEKNRMKEVELQMRGANIQFADVKCEVLREALRESRHLGGAAVDPDAGTKIVHVAVHAPSADGQRDFTGRFLPHSLSRSSFHHFLASRGASGLCAREGNGRVVTAWEDVTAGEEYVLVRGGWDGEDLEGVWTRLTAATAASHLESHLAPFLGHSGSYRRLGTSAQDGRIAVLLQSDPSRTAVLEFLPSLSPPALPTPLGALVARLPHPQGSPLQPPPRPVHILASPSIPPAERNRLFALSPVDLLCHRNEWEGGWTVSGRKRLVEVAAPEAEDGARTAARTEAAERERAGEEAPGEFDDDPLGVILEPMNAWMAPGGGLDKVVTGDIVER